MAIIRGDAAAEEATARLRSPAAITDDCHEFGAGRRPGVIGGGEALPPGTLRA